MYKNQRNTARILAGLFCAIALFVVPLEARAANQEGVTIQAGAANTKTRDVTLTIHKTFAASHMRISNNESFTGAFWESVQSEKKWTLDVGAGTKTVYVQFKNRLEAESAVFRDSITLSIPAAMNVSFSINGNAKETSSRYVNLSFTYSDGVEAVAIHNSENLAGALFTKIQSPMQWILSENSGTKTVYVMFRNVNGTTKTVQQSIVYKEPVGSFPPETLLKGDTDTVYYLGYDGRIHPFLHSIVYHSYYPGFAGIRYVSNRKIREYIIGEPVCLRPGTWLVKFKSLPRVYSVEPGCVLRPIRSEAEAYVVYGPKWTARIVEIGPEFEGFYTIYENSGFVRNDDRDQDGIDSETEYTYGTSDVSGDSDADRLNDYEEIYFWFTDPTQKDTDGDGVIDGDEIMLQRQPNGNGTITQIPEYSYRIPTGSVVFRWWQDSKYYYFYQDGLTYFLSTYPNEPAFTTNGFQPSFVLTPPIPFTVTPREGWRVLENTPLIKIPLITKNGSVTPL